MTDPFDAEMERRQKLICEKLAEIGVTVQPPVQFMKIPHGPIAGQLGFTWDDTSKLQAAMEADDEFAQIVAAEKAAEAEEREKALKEAEQQALADLAALADDVDDDE